MEDITRSVMRIAVVVIVATVAAVLADLEVMDVVSMTMIMATPAS